MQGSDLICSGWWLVASSNAKREVTAMYEMNMGNRLLKLLHSRKVFVVDQCVVGRRMIARRVRLPRHPSKRK